MPGPAGHFPEGEGGFPAARSQEADHAVVEGDGIVIVEQVHIQGHAAARRHGPGFVHDLP